MSGQDILKTYAMINKSMGTRSMGQVAVYKLFRHFKEGQQSLDDMWNGKWQWFTVRIPSSESTAGELTKSSGRLHQLAASPAHQSLLVLQYQTKNGITVLQQLLYSAYLSLPITAIPFSRTKLLLKKCRCS
jgi:hypothetical protein